MASSQGHSGAALSPAGSTQVLRPHIHQHHGWDWESQAMDWLNNAVHPQCVEVMLLLVLKMNNPKQFCTSLILQRGRRLQFPPTPFQAATSLLKLNSRRPVRSGNGTRPSLHHTIFYGKVAFKYCLQMFCTQTRIKSDAITFRSNDKSLSHLASSPESFRQGLK